MNKANDEKLSILASESDIAGSVIKELALFDSIVERSLKDYSSHHISQYLLKLSSEFNKWYGNDRILDGSEDQSHKLAVAKAVSVVLKNGLKLLGIEVVEKI